MLRRQNITRYVAPLREGGSLPGLVEADDGYKYAAKWRGGGHGSKSLIAELVGGEVARALGLRVPELVLLDLSVEFGRTEGDQEVQDLLRASQGLNLGLHFLQSALAIDAYANPVDAELASKIVWLDAYIANVDRTARNTNMLLMYNEPWLIDHGASLYFHHSATDPVKAALSPFTYVKDHLFLRKATQLEQADQWAHSQLMPDKIDAIVAAIPDEWIDPQTPREAYATFLHTRLENSKIFVDHAQQARTSL